MKNLENTISFRSEISNLFSSVTVKLLLLLFDSGVGYHGFLIIH